MSYEKIEIIVELYEYVNYKGRKIVLTENTSELITYGFENKTGSIHIKRGPDYEGKKHEVCFYDERNYEGGRLCLTGPTSYPKLSRPYNFDTVISSVKFDSTVRPPQPNIKVPLVVELYEDVNFEGRKIIILEDAYDLQTAYNFGKITSSVKVLKGPDYKKGDMIRLCSDVKGKGSYLELGVGEYSNIHSKKFRDFGDLCLSVIINTKPKPKKVKPKKK